jgi:hypothetical protein
MNNPSVPRTWGFASAAICLAVCLAAVCLVWHTFFHTSAAVANRFSSVEWAAGTPLQELPIEGPIVFCQQSSQRWTVYAAGKMLASNFKLWLESELKKASPSFGFVASDAEFPRMKPECLPDRLNEQPLPNPVEAKGDHVVRCRFQASDRLYEIDFNERTCWFLLRVTVSEKGGR